MATSTLDAPLLSLPSHTHLATPTPPSTASPTVNNDRYCANHHRTLKLIGKCSNIDHLKQVHAHMLRLNLFFDPYSSSKLFNLCAFAHYSTLDYAQQVFDQIPQPNLFTWNALIRAYASSSNPDKALFVFLQMLHLCPDSPNKFTFPFVIKAASEVMASGVGRVLHGTVIKASPHFSSDVFILNSLIHFYGSCGDVNLAYRVFANMLDKDVVSWNSMITAFVQGDCPEEALELFRQMEMNGLKPTNVTMVAVMSACAKKLDLEFGKWVCSFIERNEIGLSLTLNNSMLDMYTKCGSLEDARVLFDRMAEKDIVSWTTMLVGYARMGKYDEAQRVFYAMPNQDIAAWNALISAYEQNGKPKEALTLFYKLQVNKHVMPDQITLVSTLSACAQLGALDLGGWIHVYAKKRGIKLNCHVTTSLIDMYAKCGDIKKALEVFQMADRRDVCVWSAMISGLAMHGQGKAAVDLFEKMLEAKVKPNDVTFTNVLSACSHSGLVREGRALFSQMGPVYGVMPGLMHYGCMVDILGRAGCLEEAAELVEKMPMVPSASVWLSLLGACSIHGNSELAEKACCHVFHLEPNNHGAFVLLSNTYAKAGNWERVSCLRKQMRESGVKKEKGCSLIEVDGTVHEFLVGDNSNPLSEKIYSKLDELVTRLKSVGYVPNKSELLQLVEEEEVKEQALYQHSEKLAISFGLISTSPLVPIRIVKNIRVCGDCHSFAKLVSEVYDRQILLRDRYRFHHFKGGKCSCKDYW
ncbi:E motif [Dillenia turbinata]|uniref:E motif n=1 Tax=Dillenia turbinata TaxID=194707 RepID=A0AAN8V404_9MAGN